jgi:hypothetical protein
LGRKVDTQIEGVGGSKTSAIFLKPFERFWGVISGARK